MKIQEREILKACKEYLLLKGHKVWRQNTGAAKTEDGRFWKSSDIKGIPDLVGCTNRGRFLGVECKSKTGKQSREQKMFENMITGVGGLYVLARSIENLQKAGL